MEPLSYVIVNARVWTGDPRRPWAEAVAVRGSHIAHVGGSAELRKSAARTTRIIDAHGGMLLPGFIDAHLHFLEGGRRLASVQLRDARTPAELAARVEAHARTLADGAWVLGGDWDHTRWGGGPGDAEAGDGGTLPTRAWIDGVTPDHPVWIARLDGHMALANSRALALAGVTRDTADVPGGTIVRDALGEPTGVLKDQAMTLVARVVPRGAAAADDRALERAMRYVAERGVTTVGHMGTWEDLAVFERAHAHGALRTRISAAVPLATWERLRDRIARDDGARGDDWLRVGGLKAYVDGSLGSHTAAMLEPYSDSAATGDRGLLVTEPEVLAARTAGADAAGLQVIVHAIGDRANRIQLDIFERVAREHGPRDRRFRIEHAQHLAPADIPRFGALGVIASMQPYHAVDDGRWAERLIGRDRARTTHPWRALLDSGATLAFGSDWFVAPPSALAGIEAAVTRRLLDGSCPGGWVPEQRIGVEEALRAYGTGAAFATFREREVGIIRAGWLADLVLLERDITRIPPEEIGGTGVRMTMVGGAPVYEHDP